MATVGERTSIVIGEYRLNRPDEIETPAFLVYEDMVRYNVAEVVRICGSADRVVPHAKTHKSAEVLKLQMEGGITAFKCATLEEAELLAENGVKEIIISFPMLHPAKIRRFVALAQRHPDVDLKTIASTPEHLEAMSTAALANDLEVGIYMDIDTGMRRTGVQPGQEAGDFYARIANTPGLRAIGVHLFDGHVLGMVDAVERQARVDESIEHIRDVWDRAEKRGLEVSDNVVGGSWSFHMFLHEKRFRVSPGTWVYWDVRNSAMKELGFKIAGVVLGQVVDRDPEMDTVTLDVGSKAASPDLAIPDRFRVVGHEQTEVVSQSEEHGVVKLNGATLDVGDMVLVAPGHACTTSHLYPEALVVNSDGDVVGKYGHQARDR